MMLVSVSVRQPSAVFCVPLRLPLHLEDLSKAARDRRTLQADLVVVGAIDISDKHVDSTVVALLGHGKHFVKGPRSGQEREQTP